MANTITNCPKCKSLILSDTLQCPSCNHILNESLTDVIKANEKASLLSKKVAEEKTCKDCGVNVRAGVVRCWNCGAFMQEGLEQTFRAKQAQPQEVILSDIAETKNISPTKRQPVEEDYDDEADFELSSETELINEQGTEEDFELSGNSAWSTPLSDEESGEIDISSNQLDNSEGDEEEAEEDDSNVDPEMRDFLKMVIREDAADFAKKSRRNKTRTKKTARIVQEIPGGFVVIPPCKCCKVKIRETDLGKQLACPKCKVSYHAPEPLIKRTRTIEANQENEQSKGVIKQFNAKTIAITKSDLKYSNWLEFAYLHEYIAEKTKNKPGIMAKTYIPVDIGFSDENLLILEFAKKPGAFARDDKRIAKLRETLREMIKAETKLENTKEYEIYEIPIGWLSSVKVLYPVTETDKTKIPFGGVPVFGEGRIGVKFPASQAGDYTVSMTLSQYRGFLNCCLEKYGFIRFAEGSPLGQDMTLSNATCPFSKKSYSLVNDAEFYLHDNFIKLEKVGGICESCNMFVSTAGETEEKARITKLIAESKKKKSPQPMGVAGLSNQAPKLPAKGKCILCNKNFGNKQAYILASTENESKADSKKKVEVKK